MDSSTCFLITLLYGDTLLRCALKVKAEDDPHSDISDYPMEPESRATLHRLLPDHVRDVGPIVNVEEIFDISV